VAVSVRGISCITCSGVLSSFSSRMRRSSVVLNMAKFLLVLRTCRPNKKPPGLAACSEFGLQLLLLECARSSHRQRAVVAKVPKIAGGAVDHGRANSLAARICHPPITRSYGWCCQLVSGLSCRERHADQGGAAEHQVETGQKTDGPFRRAGEPGDDDAGDDDVHGAADQKP